MSSARTKTKAWISGFCSPTNPEDSHARCDEHPRADGTPCSCLCHMAPEPVLSIAPDRLWVLPDTPVTVTGLPDDPTGFHSNVPEGIYHGHPTSLSVTGAKLLLKAPALYKYRQSHPQESRTFDFGHAAHAKVLGVGAEIVPLLRTDPKTGETWEADSFSSPSVGKHAAEIRAAGKTPLLQKEIEQVDAMAEALADVPLIQQFMANGEAEVSAFCVDEETGVMRRSRFDLLDDLLIDYKTTVDAEPQACARSAAKYGYHCQHAWYEQIAIDLGRKVRGFLFIFQEKTAPYLTSVVELDAEAVARGAELNRRALERFRDCTESGRWPGYGDQIVPISLPKYALFDTQEPT